MHFIYAEDPHDWGAHNQLYHAAVIAEHLALVLGCPSQTLAVPDAVIAADDWTYDDCGRWYAASNHFLWADDVPS